MIELLRTRAVDCRQTSMTARLAAVLGPVEMLLGRGYARSQVVEILTEVGWRFTTDSFDSALTRVRKRRLNACTGVSAAPTAAVVNQSAAVSLLSTASTQSDEASPAADASSDAEEKPEPGFTDVFFAQRRPDGGPRWK
ncbi:hypothetical protein ACNRDG_06575 [Ralstonia pseudosolanacearum]|uniref:hypothetical protein n=1 Tax=Ralstonia pseudosolanacearum TaxID=1310165 RepID=UPI003AAE9755